MKMLKRSLFIAIFTIALTAFANPSADKSPQTRYVEKYSLLAVDEMYRSGVPASITLAQGLLESRYGLSELATTGNNHFGIKCHNDWQGGKVYHDDDRKGECFRKYDSPEQSFRDHSDFLRYRDRYKFLFDLEVNDYKGWAYGLKKAGYATDPAYPAKLIKLIEDYRLYMYDIAPSDYGSYEADDVEDYAEAVKRDEDRRKKNAGSGRKIRAVSRRRLSMVLFRCHPAAERGYFEGCFRKTPLFQDGYQLAQKPWLLRKRRRLGR